MTETPPTTLADWLALLETRHPRSIDLGLARIRAVAECMALPRPATHVITVGGTNGKGSTVAFLEAIARAQGWRVGAYTSPHLLRYHERVRIEGVEPDDAAWIAAFTAIDAARGDIGLTYFEVGTLAALWLFARQPLDLVVLEVGLGGRLDATNIVDADVAVITTVDLDHQDWLGNDIETIGAEKAGIARAWKPLVLGDDDPPASMLRHAYAIGASALRIGCDFFLDPIDDTTWRWREVGYSIDLPMPALAAPVQQRNAAIAIAALRALPVEMSDAAIQTGIAHAQAPARLQRIAHGELEVLVDVGHNPQAARALAAALAAQPKRTHAVYAALADKDVDAVVTALREHIAEWHLAGIADAGARNLAADALRARVQDALQSSIVHTHSDVAAAMQAALAAAVPGERVLVFGSFHTAAQALQRLAAR